MNKNIKIIGLQGIPLIHPGDDISSIILDAIEKNNLSLENGDVILIAQTIISKSNGQIRNLDNVEPTEEALNLSENINQKAKILGMPSKKPELIQAILDESIDIVKAEHVLITETKHGFVCANAGIDKSNVEGKSNVAMLPENPDEDALKIRNVIKNTTHKDVAIIITDSFGRPFRVGAIGVAVGISGMDTIIDKRGSKDLFGHELESTIVGQADNLASAAQLMMGESDEGLPIVLIRGYEYKITENTSIGTILRKKNQDLFRLDNSSENLIEILKNRRSYKFDFSSKPVDMNLIKEAIEIARWAPSAHNGQFWRYIILDDDDNRQVLIDSMNQKLNEDLIRDGKQEKYIKKKTNKTRNRFIQSPYLIVSCLDTKDLDNYSDLERTQNEFLLGVQSVSSSITYLLLALEVNGLAACWYCAPLFAKKIVKKILDLPDTYVPMAFITVGHPKKAPKAPSRKELSEIMFNRIK